MREKRIKHAFPITRANTADHAESCRAEGHTMEERNGYASLERASQVPRSGQEAGRTQI